jgi:hypothetical protein
VTLRWPRAWMVRPAAVAPAQAEGGLVGYGLGIERRVSFALNTAEDPTSLVIAVVQALTEAKR